MTKCQYKAWKRGGFVVESRKISTVLLGKIVFFGVKTTRKFKKNSDKIFTEANALVRFILATALLRINAVLPRFKRRTWETFF